MFLSINAFFNYKIGFIAFKLNNNSTIYLHKNINEIFLVNAYMFLIKKYENWMRWAL